MKSDTIFPDSKEFPRHHFWEPELGSESKENLWGRNRCRNCAARYIGPMSMGNVMARVWYEKTCYKEMQLPDIAKDMWAKSQASIKARIKQKR